MFRSACILVLLCSLKPARVSSGVKGGAPLSGIATNGEAQKCRLESTSHNDGLLQALVCNCFPNRDDIREMEKIKVLKIHDVMMDQLDLSMFSRLGLNDLKVLQVTNCSVNTIVGGTHAFRGMPILEEIDLSANLLKSIPIDLFASASQIRKIVVRNNLLETFDLSPGRLESLNILDLSGNRLSALPKNLPLSLTQLNLGDNYITTLGSISRRLTNIQHLNLCGNSLTLFEPAKLFNPTKLHHLCLSEVQNIQHFEGFGLFTELEQLTLSGKGAQGDPLTGQFVNKMISECQKLQSITINNYEMSSFVISKPMMRLETLELKQVFIWNTTSTEFFDQLPNLKTIDLSGSRRLAKDLLALNKSSSVSNALGKVQRLTIHDCDIENFDWLGISSRGETALPSLKTLDVSRNILECDQDRTRWVICRFLDSSEAERYEPNYPDEYSIESDEKDQHQIIKLVNTNQTWCRDSSKLPVSKSSSVSEMIKDVCPSLNSPSPRSKISESGRSIKDNTNAPSSREELSETVSRGPIIGYAILAVLLVSILAIVLVLSFKSYRKRQCLEAHVPQQFDDERTGQEGTCNPDTQRYSSLESPVSQNSAQQQIPV